jgi:hypothetical protein
MKVKNLNITFEWETIRDIPNFVEINRPFPKYNIKVRNSENTLLESHLDLDKYEPIIDFKIESLPRSKKTKCFSNVSNNKVKNTFKYNFQNNYESYKKLNNKLGFFKKLIFQIDYYNDNQDDFIAEAEYPEIENLNKNNLFNKVYRSSDYLNIKLLINRKYFKEKEIHSFLVLSNISNSIVKNKDLQNIFVENIEQKWLDVNENTSLLTIPYTESDMVEISENLNIIIIPLNYVQSEMYKFLKEKHTEKDINDMICNFYPNQVFNIGKVYKQTVNNETLIFYQNYIYLFNNDSLTLNSLQTDLNINDITFNKYFPLLNKDQSSKTICLSDDLNTDDVLDNMYNIQKDYLGYYSKNLSDYEDVAIDLDYLQNQGIKRVKIVEIEELADACNIYIEFITNFYSNEKFYIETSNNLKFHEKYKTNIENKEYVTFVFKYTYSLDSLNSYLSQNPDKNKSQIISEKDLINFSAKIVF